MPRKQFDPTDGHVGAKVRLRRMLIGMSQETLAEHLSLTFQHVQKYEKGVNRIGAGRLFEIGRILGVPVTFFYEGLEEGAAPDGKGLSNEAQRIAIQLDAIQPDDRRTQAFNVVSACLRAYEKEAAPA